MRQRTRQAGALLLLLGSLAAALFIPEFDTGLRSLDRLHDFAHVPAFAAVAIALCLLSSSAASGGDGRLPRAPLRPLHLAAAACASVLLGTLVEVVQGLIGRSAEPADVARDAAGALAAVLLLAAMRPPDPEPGRRRSAAARVWVLRATALVTALPFLGPAALAALDEARARREFPVLAGLHAAAEIDRFRWVAADADLVAVHVGEPPEAGGAAGHEESEHRALRLRLHPALYPRLELRWFPRDWRGWGALRFRVTNEGSNPFRLVIRIHDGAHSGEFLDRFTTSRVLPPGPTEVVIGLDAVLSAPRGRRMDLSSIRSVILYGVEVREPRTLLLENFRLTAEP